MSDQIAVLHWNRQPTPPWMWQCAVILGIRHPDWRHSCADGRAGNAHIDIPRYGLECCKPSGCACRGRGKIEIGGPSDIMESIVRLVLCSVQDMHPWRPIFSIERLFLLRYSPIRLRHFGNSEGTWWWPNLNLCFCAHHQRHVAD